MSQSQFPEMGDPLCFRQAVPHLTKGSHGGPPLFDLRLQAFVRYTELGRACLDTHLEFVPSPLEPVLCMLAFRDVFCKAGDTEDLTPFVSDRKGPHKDPSHGAVGPDDPVFRKLGRGGLTGASPVDIVDHLLPVFLHHSIQPGARVRVKALARATRQGLIGRADVEHLAPIRRGQPEGLLDGLGDLPEPLFVLFQPSDHRVDDPEKEDHPEEQYEKAPSDRDDAGPDIGLPNLGQVDLGYDAPTQSCYGFVGRQYDGAPVISADQGPGHPGQGPAHRLGAIRVKGDGTRALSFFVPVAQEERDVIPLAPGESELPCLGRTPRSVRGRR